MNIIHTNKTQIYAIGDVHGNFGVISYWIKTHDLKNCAFIFCGDFGLGFDGLQKEREELNKVNTICEERDIECYIIRGNHDDPDYYNTTLYKLDLSRFKPLSDYSVISNPEHNILCLGGAVSVDRTGRINAYESEVRYTIISRHISEEKAREKVKCYWWKGEGFNFNPDIITELKKDGIEIDTICSHSAPESCYPLVKGKIGYWLERDGSLDEDLANERRDFQILLNLLKEDNHPIKNWFYGHFHEHHTETVEGVSFHLLDMSRNNLDMKEI